MGRILRDWRVFVACVFSALIIFAAYMLATGTFTPRASASEEAKLLVEIATRDSDGDGLVDWEEGLYGTDPKNTDSLSLGMSDGEAVSRGLIVPKAMADLGTASSTPGGIIVDPSLPPAPAQGTLTATFTQDFFDRYVMAKQAKGGEALSGEEIKAIADESLAALSSSVVTAPLFKTEKDIVISGSGRDALGDYAARAEAVLLAHTVNAGESEIVYLKYAVEEGNLDALPPILSIAQGYRESALGLSVLAVPQELVQHHLALVNSLMRLSEILSDFARVNTDPLATMLALQQYPDALLTLGASFISIEKTYRESGLALAEGAPGSSFVNLIAAVAASQAASKKP